MKTLRISLLFFFLYILTVACSADDDNTILKDDASETALIFDLKTAEDQMGEFAENRMVVFNGKVWSVGGDNSYNAEGFYNNDVWSSDNGIHWRSVSSNRFEARYRHTLTVFNDQMWIIGGENNSGDFLSDIWRSMDGETWVNVTMTAPFGTIRAHTTTVFNNKMYVIGPSSADTNMIVWSTVDGVLWTEENSNAFEVRGNHKTIVFNDALYVIGGRDESNRFNEIWTSTDGANWSLVTISSSIFSGRDLHTVTVYNDKVWVINGQSNTSRVIKDIWYSSDLRDWTLYESSIPFQSLHSHSSLVYEDELWLFGGYGATETSGEIWSLKEDGL